GRRGATRTTVLAARADRRGGEVARMAPPREDRRAQALVRDSGGEGLMRVYFATDLHGSETCWRKFLNAGQHYKADVIVLGGDMTGKALVPVIDDGGGHWHATLLENRTVLEGEEQVAAFENAVVRRGYYPFRATPEEVRELHENEASWHALFSDHMLKTVERWMEIADEKLEGTDIACYVCP